MLSGIAYGQEVIVLETFLEERVKHVPAQSVPVFFNPEQVPYDECLDIVAEDAYETGRRLVKSDGVFLGQSAAAALKAATIIAERPEASGKNIAIIMADNAFKYLSTKMYVEE